MKRYHPTTPLSITLAALATSAGLVAGRGSAAVNAGDITHDVLLSGKITTGTSPVAGQIEVWVYGALSLDDAGVVVYPDTILGTDAAVTLTSADIKSAGLRVGAVLTVDTNSNRTYPFAPLSVASLFGGVMPRRWGVFVTQNSTVNLHATASNHAIYQTPIETP